MKQKEILQFVETAKGQLELLKKDVVDWRCNKTEPFYKDIENIDRSIKLSQDIAETLLTAIGTSQEELSAFVFELHKIKRQREKAIAVQNAIQSLNRLMNVFNDQQIAHCLVKSLRSYDVSFFDKINIPGERRESIHAIYQEELKKMAKTYTYFQKYIE
ncbi:MAG: hypothetical protein WC878_00715 [Candidatus Paceibacterota bacterium]|jgi:hypothetical protein